MRQPLELYIHIPFCARKCLYCDFLSGPASELSQHGYVEQLLLEIERESDYYQGYGVVSVFLGGGTPSILKAEDVTAILASVRRCFDVMPGAEITIEANPGTLKQEKLEAYRACGINRISLGLQSADNQELKTLGRIHTFEEFLKTYQRVRLAGFDNVNIDLMSALPGQTLASWKNTLRQVLMLKPEHISAYSLMIEEGTPFMRRTMTIRSFCRRRRRKGRSITRPATSCGSTGLHGMRSPITRCPAMSAATISVTGPA